MAKVEQLMCGINPENPDGGRTILSYSPGMGKSVCEEVTAFCRGWGSEPPGGLARPAVLSFPLRSTMPSLRGQLFAVVRVSTTVPAYFHAVVMTKTDFRSFAYNPFAVVQAGGFLDVWSSGARLATGQIQPPQPGSLFSPPPNPGDVGLVDEALQEFLVKGRLVLNLEAATQGSDRVLSMVIHLMPSHLREKLRFASFSPSGDNTYGLAAAFAQNTPFTSWQRLFMTMIERTVPESIRQYVSRIRNGLIAGDLTGLDQAATNLRPAVAPSSTRPRPALEPLASSSVPINQEFQRQGKPALSTRTLGAGPVAGPMVAPAMVSGYLASGAGSSMRGPARNIRPGKGGRSRTPLVRQAVSLNKRHTARKTRHVAVFLTIVAVLAAGWVYLEKSGKGRQWGVFDLANWGQTRQVPGKAPSLLEVVDVGKDYSQILNKIQRTGLVPGTDGDQARRRAQADLQARVAGPLLLQADLFLDLARDGIQQGKRPDREKERLRALDGQGKVVAEELALLELAYYSLREGALWQDLDRLGHDQVMARRDSLAKAAPKALAETSREVGTQPYWEELATARRNVSGMASLLALFEAPRWSREWEKSLQQAAEKVSPTASPMSRAYRNNAFLLVRLKKAERLESSRAVAYGPDLSAGSWPPSAVQDILVDMRRKIGLFGSNEMPGLLAGMLAVYQKMSDPLALAREGAHQPAILQDLAANRAVTFHGEVFSPYLNRLRFEAIRLLEKEGTSLEDVPSALWQGFSSEDYQLFRETLQQRDAVASWQDLAERQKGTFLGQWARYQATEVEKRMARRQERHDLAWNTGRELAADLSRRAAQGQDWTSIFVDLQDELKTILAASPSSLEHDPLRADQRDQAAELLVNLTQPAVLEISAVVVRLDQDILPGPAEVTVELILDRTGQVMRSGRLKMGPAAPAGTGWVGNTTLDWLADVSTGDSFTATVRTPGRSAPLLDIHYPSLEDRVGPGAMVRPRQGQGGSLVFRTTDNWWRRMGLQ